MKKFLIDMAERCIGTFAEAFLGSIAACTALGDIDWVLSLSTAGLATLVTMLKCIIAKCKGDTNSASFIE